MVETLLAGSRGKRLEFRYYKWTEKVSFWVILGEDCVESFNSLKDAVEKYNEF